MIDLKNYGYTRTETPPKGLIPGRVTEIQRDLYTAITEKGEITAKLKGSFYHDVGGREDFPCVGDFVFLQYNETGDSRIAELLPRHSKFSRQIFQDTGQGTLKQF